MLVLVVGGYFAQVLVWRPFQCNVIKEKAQRTAIEMWGLPLNARAIFTARDHVKDLRKCVLACPADVDMYMTLALHYRLMGRLSEAIESYRKALEYDQRPELFFNLGLVQLELDQRQAALENLVTACRFDIYYADDIPDPELRQQVVAEVERYRAAAD